MNDPENLMPLSGSKETSHNSQKGLNTIAVERDSPALSSFKPKPLLVDQIKTNRVAPEAYQKTRANKSKLILKTATNIANNTGLEDIIHEEHPP